LRLHAAHTALSGKEGPHERGKGQGSWLNKKRPYTLCRVYTNYAGRFGCQRLEPTAQGPLSKKRPYTGPPSQQTQTPHIKTAHLQSTRMAPSSTRSARSTCRRRTPIQEEVMLTEDVR
jgi:hypothetical protein